MKNYTNIYDIDGELIRAAGDNHKFTVDEIEQMVDKWSKKVEENPDNKVYKVYLNNLNSWLFNMYNNMSKDEVLARFGKPKDTIEEAKQAATEEEQKSLDELNLKLDDIKQLYEENTPKETVMDEYVDFEEVKDE